MSNEDTCNQLYRGSLADQLAADQFAVEQLVAAQPASAGIVTNSENLYPPPESITVIGDNDTYEPSVDCLCANSIDPADASAVVIMDEQGLLAIGAGSDTSYKLGADITVTTTPWVPINRATGNTILFDGQSYSIYGLTRPLFLKLPAYSTARNVTLEAVNMEIQATETTLVTAGGFVCDGNNCTLNGIHVNGTILAWNDKAIVGGVVGDTKGALVQNCTSNTTIISRWIGGGIAGQSNSNFKSCVNYGNVNVGSVTIAEAFGGIVGNATAGDIGYLGEGCTNYGTITTSTATVLGLTNKVKYTGGIVGHLATTAAVTYCTNSGNVYGGTYVGGIAGYEGIVRNCVVTFVDITGVDYISGIIGKTNAQGGVTNNRCGAKSVKSTVSNLTTETWVSRIGWPDSYTGTKEDENYFNNNCAASGVILRGRNYLGWGSTIPTYNDTTITDTGSDHYGPNKRQGINCDTTDLPKWSVVFNLQNNTPNLSRATDSAGKLNTPDSGLAASFPPDPTPPDPANMTFKGWFDAPSGGTQYTAPFTFPGNRTLYAQYQCKGGLTYDVNSQTCYSAIKVLLRPQNGDVNTNVNTKPNGTIATPYTPTNSDGTEFLGWFTDETGGEQWSPGMTFSPGSVLYAQWDCPEGQKYDYEQAECYTAHEISLRPHNGKPTTYDYADPQGYISKLPAPAYTPPGAVFAGWWTTETSGGIKWTAGMQFTKDTTLHARWTCAGVGMEYDPVNGCEFSDECPDGYVSNGTECLITVRVKYGNGDPDLVRNLSYGEPFILPDAPTGGTGTFLGWQVSLAPTGAAGKANTAGSIGSAGALSKADAANTVTVEPFAQETGTFPPGYELMVEQPIIINALYDNSGGGGGGGGGGSGGGGDGGSTCCHVPLPDGIQEILAGMLVNIDANKSVIASMAERYFNMLERISEETNLNDPRITKQILGEHGFVNSLGRLEQATQGQLCCILNAFCSCGMSCPSGQATP
ncbi:hypothetical protein FACS1894184_10320 [Clostridia bacterium]|nr:hypothetical protein FACS1894184_10320 [Clostridia bacterium]